MTSRAAKIKEPPMKIRDSLLLLLASLLLSCFATLGAASTDDAATLPGRPADIAPSAYQYRADRKPDENPPESWIGLMKYAGLPLEQAGGRERSGVEEGALRPDLGRGAPGAPRGTRLERRAAAQAEARGGRRDLLRRGGQGNIPTWWNETVLREARQTGGVRRRAHVHLRHPRGHVRSGRQRARANGMPRPTKSPRSGPSRPIGGRRWTWRSSGGSTSPRRRLDYSGRIEAYDGIVDRLSGRWPAMPARPSRMTCNWVSAPKGDGRRGVRLSLLYMGTSKWRKVWPYNAERGRRGAHHRHGVDPGPATSRSWRPTWRRGRSSRRSTASSCAPRELSPAETAEAALEDGFQVAAGPQDGRLSRQRGDSRLERRRRHAVVRRQRHGPARHRAGHHRSRLAAWPCTRARTATWPSAGAARSRAG